MDRDPIRYWHELTSSELEGLMATDPVVVLPLAALEQHGPHLPLSTDVEIGMGLLRAAFQHLPEGFPALSLPSMALGASAEHLAFPGTVSLEPEHLSSLIVACGSAVARAGGRRLLLSNSHGGNRGVLETAALKLRREYGLLVVKASWFRFSRPIGVDLPEAEWRHGLHGGAVETALMRVLRPDRVRESRAKAAPSLGRELEGRLRRLAPEGEASFAWLAGDLHASGVTGDPSLGTPQVGEALVEHYGSILAEVIQDAREFPLDRLGEGE